MNTKERNKEFYIDILTTELIVIILFAVYRFFASDFYGIHSPEEVPLWRIAYIISGRGNLPAFSGFGYSSFGYSLMLAPIVFIFGGGALVLKVINNPKYKDDGYDYEDALEKYRKNKK